ncbi:PREDICTED: heat shock 70 kDa protein 12A-like [Amphimedon queenslandica]|nr:PREDICTED: heat shock 70 kDa protein 12A-like [Amphimedon queenslandica]|eukprot:XP_019859370.1 PREDICTED: heat shock 70 kDa protein 12A-like [Amphimedon queenslandica]
MFIVSSNDTKCYLVEVIAFILQYLKKELSNHLVQSGSGVQISDFDWVITVPAIWQSRGKRMMREAAYQAGLCTTYKTIDRFIQVGYGMPKQDEDNPDKLSLALEPEAAAIYCQTMSSKAMPDHCKIDGSIKSDRYLVIDIGGGTVDITAHRHNEEQGIEVITEPIGNDCGGMKVNQEFSKLLQKIVKDEGCCAFSRFLDTKESGVLATRKAIINKLLNLFETAKVTFGNTACGKDSLPVGQDDDDIAIELPYQFVEFYGVEEIESGVAALQDDRIELDDTTLYMKFSLVAELFQPAIDGILSCTASVLERLKGDIDTIYLVGGFGGCKYVYEKISTLNQAKYKEHNIRIIVPKDHSLAVAQGAVKYRLEPDIICSRIMDATYGTDICPPYLPGRHDRKYFVGIDSRGIPRRRDVLLHYVDRGEVIKSDEVVTAELCPLSDAAKSMKIDLYSTLDKDLEYIKDEEEKPIPSVRKIGQIEVDMPNQESLPREKRLVEMTMDFSHTEIQVRAHYTVTGMQVKTTLDFLTDNATQ